VSEPGTPSPFSPITEASAAEAIAELEAAQASAGRRLTPRQAAFVAEYMLDLNATKAAERAGYEPTFGPGLLRHKPVSNAVARSLAQRELRINIKQDDVLLEMSLLANSRIDHYVVDDEGQVTLADGAPEGAMAAVQSIKRKKTVRQSRDGDLTITYDVEIRLWDKTGPLKLIGRHIGLFHDRIEVTGKDGGPIETISEVRRVIVRTPPDDATESRPEAVH
jgi:phage terminase small subunit